MKNHKFSLITPTHNPKYLSELHDSLKNQTYQNWEWIVYLNGSVEPHNLPLQIRQDPKVTVFKQKEDYGDRIGKIKKEAFSLGTGDVLVEMDHDDMLREDCLEELNNEYQDPEIGFVYSEDSKLQTNGEFNPYGSYYGWSWYETEWHGHKMKVMRNFEASSLSMTMIYWQPNHVRSWRREIYHALGGHDESLDILDDQDLIARTYLVTRMKNIRKPLYIYRIDGGNSWLKKIDKIGKETVQMMHKYGMSLAERDADLQGKTKIQLGDAEPLRKGYIYYSLEDYENNKGFFLRDDSVGVIYAPFFPQRIQDTEKFMSECHRILCNNGWFFTEIPSTDGRGAWMDPRNKSFWNENSFLYYTHRNQAKYINNTKIRFQSWRKETRFLNQWYEDNKIPTTVAWLTALKTPNRTGQPGGIDI
jgi:glycosyltransferase involved in cell wall biosynthesis